MNYEVVTLKEKMVVGLTAKTGNTDPDCQKIISGLWGSFMGGTEAAIKNRSNPYSVGLYSDYDFVNMTYDVTVGAEVSENSNPELSVKIIPAGQYACFSVRGDVVTDVGNAWNEIWDMPLERSFSADFEEYISNENGVADVKIYLALK